jgi:hypothetical protein
MASIKNQAAKKLNIPRLRNNYFYKPFSTIISLKLSLSDKFFQCAFHIIGLKII